MTAPRRIATLGLVAVCLMAASAVPVVAQVEVSVEAGYTSSEGINASQSHIVLGQVYNSLDIPGGGSFGLTVGGFFTENWEAEFLWHRQLTSLQASNPSPALKLATQDVDNYHGNIVYNFGARESKLRPFA